MKTIFKKWLIPGFLLSLLCSCGGGSVEQKGWDAHIQEMSIEVGKSVDELKEILQKDLILRYVYVNDTVDEISVNCVYYKGAYGNTGKYGSIYYFAYNVVGDYTLSCDEELYNLAYDYVCEFGGGKNRSFKFRLK